MQQSTTHLDNLHHVHALSPLQNHRLYDAFEKTGDATVAYLTFDRRMVLALLKNAK